jgi:glycosyltransferase involved in cell wall biosynthesis
VGARTPEEAMSEPVRVAVLGSAAVPHTGRWTAALVARGIEARVWSLEPPVEDDPAPCRIELLPTAALPGVFRYPLAAPALRKALAAFDPEVIDAHFVPNYGVLGVLSRRRPLVVNAWGSDLLTAHDPLRRARLSWVLSRADHVRVDAHNLAKVARGLGVGEGKLEVLPWGAETERFAFSPNREARLEARRAWPREWAEAAGEGPVAVSTRMHHPVYAIDTLIDAWPAVTEAQPKALCLVAGDGPRRAALEARARRRGAASSLRFLGRQPQADLALLLAGADAYVSTSLSDSTSLSLLEAMSAGAYPVVSAIDGNREWVTPESGFLFAPGDVGALARGLCRALSDPVRFDGARAANRALIESRGDWNRAMDRVAERTTALALARRTRA